MLFPLVAFELVLPWTEDSIIDSKREALRELTRVVVAQLERSQQSVSLGSKSLEEAQKEAIDYVRSIRYGREGKSYFWIHDLSGKFVMHPYRPDLENIVPSHLDKHTKALLIRMNQLVNKQGNGFVKYLWQLNEYRDQMSPKESFIELFRPWGWVVGTGLYTEDVKTQIGEFRTKAFIVIALVLLLVLAVALMLAAFVFRSEKAKAQALTRSQNLESQLLQSQKMETLGTLAGGIAHDFNNILTAIIGFTQVAMDGAKDRVREDLKEVLKASDRAKDLVQQMLTFSRKVGQEIRPVDLRELVMESVRMMRASAPADVRIIRDIPGQIISILADPVQIQQVLLNLYTNACDAMESGGTLTLYLGLVQDPHEAWSVYPELAGSELCELSVSDSGKGMDKATLERIFDPFFTTKDVNRGTGLGLSVAHGIISSLGGQIEVKSKQGEGTTFRIFLPRAEQAPGEEPIAEQKQVSVNGTERLLLVDDDAQIAKVQRRQLVNMGYSVVAVTDPVKALERIQADPKAFDVLVTDNLMPIMTGMQLIVKVRKICPDLPVVLMTGRPDKLSLDGRSKGELVSKTILKPVLAKELASAIREVLEKKS